MKGRCDLSRFAYATTLEGDVDESLHLGVLSYGRRASIERAWSHQSTLRQDDTGLRDPKVDIDSARKCRFMDELAELA